MSQTVIQAVADTKGCDPTELSPSLYEVLDPDALDAIYAKSSPHIHFDYAGYHIEITPAQSVLIQSDGY